MALTQATATEPTPNRQPAAQEFVEVTKASVILRSGPGTNFRKLGVAATGIALPVLSREGDWLRVESDSKTAWIRSDLVKTLATQTVPQPGTH